MISTIKRRLKNLEEKLEVNQVLTHKDRELAEFWRSVGMIGTDEEICRVWKQHTFAEYVTEINKREQTHEQCNIEKSSKA